MSKVTETSRLSIKKGYGASLQANGSLFIGGASGNSFELDINEAWLVDLISSLDGSRNVMDVGGMLKQRGFNVSTEDLMSYLEALFETGMLEEIEDYDLASRQSILSQEEKIRYDRQMLLFQVTGGSYHEAFGFQDRLKKAKVGLIGIGGVGSYAFYGLAAMGVGTLKACDFDKVELTNLSRQILYTQKDLGRSKIEVAKERGPQINPHTRFEFVEKMLSSVEEISEFIKGLDLVIVAADAPRGKIWPMVNEAALETGTPVLFTGSALNWVTCGPIVVPGQTPCYSCSNPEAVSDDHPVVRFMRDRYTTSLIDPYNAIGASMGVLEAVKFLTGFEKPVTLGSTFIMNLKTYETHLVPAKRNESCRFCKREEKLHVAV
jgi:molybdopterin-synthase adenylyltransferase